LVPISTSSRYKADKLSCMQDVTEYAHSCLYKGPCLSEKAAALGFARPLPR
uniref:Kazal-like domain-containing protein n=1 Tax=Haemonchus placei TaxID=6290 RepID=A0A158QLY2_HAEPC